MEQEKAEVLEHREYQGGYRLLVLRAPAISTGVVPGQFVHLLVPALDGAVLRRPFSVFHADDETLSVLYKPVGRGTHVMVSVPVGDRVDVIGPLGNGFPVGGTDTCPVLVAGGYGVAPLCLLARHLPRKGVAFIGAATAADVLCVDVLEELGWPVEVTTEDGSLGASGLVTAALDRWLDSRSEDVVPEFYACGPDGLLKAVGDRAIQGGWQGWLSLDKHMGCGVGACLACVQRIRRGGVESWGRVCKDGPIFESREIVWG